MNQEEQATREKKLNAELGKLSKEELLEVLKNTIKQCDEVKAGAKFLMSHIKVLCHKSGGKLTYSKEEFDKAAKEDPDLIEDYEMDGQIEVCVLKLVPREKIDPLFNS